MLVKDERCGATSAMKDFNAALNGMPLGMRKGMIYDLARHAEMT